MYDRNDPSIDEGIRRYFRRPRKPRKNKPTVIPSTGYWSGYRYTKLNSKGEFYAASPAAAFGWTKQLGSKTSISNPNYRQQITTFVDATTPYDLTSYEVQVPIIDLETRAKNGFRCYGFSGPDVLAQGFQGSLTTGSLQTATEDLALKRVKAKMSNLQNDFNLLCPLGELKETYGLFGQITDATEDVLKKLIHFKRTIRDPRALFKTASNAWLTYNFGVSPTLSDFQQLTLSLQDYIDRTDVVTRVVGSASSLESGTTTRSSNTVKTAIENYNWNLNNSRYRWYRTYRCKYTAGVRMNLQSANDYGLLQHLNITIPALVPTLWELTAFSWVFDYFTTTGDFLEDYFQAPAGNTIYLTKSVQQIEERIGDWTLTELSNPDAGITVQKCIAKGMGIQTVTNSFIYKRTKLAALPHRAWRLKTLNEIGANSVKRILNLASILAK